jgi:hypothetical protein
MRGVALLMVMSGVAIADLGPPQGPQCEGYDACRRCDSAYDGGALPELPLSDGGHTEDTDACVARARVDGYAEKACSQIGFPGIRTYYCKPEGEPKQGCSSIMLGAPLALLAVFGAWRTRKRA